LDLRSLKLHLVDRHARLVIADAEGERGYDLEGERYARVEEAAAPILAAIESKLGGACHLGLRAISIDAVKRVVRVSVVSPDGDSPGARFEGADWDRITSALAGLARVAVNEARPRNPNFRGTPSDAGFWQDVYATRHDGFELGRATPPLARWFAAHPPAGLRVLNPGCGRGHDARLLASAGAQVTAIDFVPEAIAEARALADQAGVAVDFRVRDVFALADEPERYDLVVEHCCFCAIEPHRRQKYLDTIARVLVPGGALVGLFWAHGREGGPPYTVSRAELEAYLAPRFELRHVEVPRDSVALRMGQELLVHALCKPLHNLHQ
jgi:SAM-dependent methyltransferase